MIPMKNLENLLNDTVPSPNNGVVSPSANEVFPTNTIYEQDPTRTPKFFQNFNLASLLVKFDFSVMGKVILLTLGVIIVFDLLVYLTTSISHRKSLMVTPWLVQVLSASWDDLNHSSSLARSDDAVGPILRSLSQAAAKYGSRWEKSRLL